MPHPQLKCVARPGRGATQAIWLLLALVWLGGWLAPVALATEPVGEVIFATGEVQLERDGIRKTLDRGEPIREGDRLETGPDSHVHLRMVDGAFISLRSQGALSVERYRFRPQAPSRSEARLTLHHGVVRSISGELGARDPSRFRLNTPVAAIGIRGTDFSTLTFDSMSRASVRRGGIVMTPLSAACHRETLSACEGQAARELFMHSGGAMLEAHRGIPYAMITREGTPPDAARPPHPQEDRLGSPRFASRVPGNGLVRGESAPGVGSYEEGLEQVERYLAAPGLASEAFALGEAAGPEHRPADLALVESPQVVWGRWNEFRDEASDEPTIAQLIYRNRRYAGLNSVFALLETVPESRRLPQRGRAYFHLNRHEAYIRRGNQLEAAAISHPGLVVDFDDQRFATRLDVHADSLPGPVHVVGGGEVLSSGHLRSDGESPSHLEGVLSPDASEAGLLFQYRVGPGVDAVGATHWVMDRD